MAGGKRNRSGSYAPVQVDTDKLAGNRYKQQTLPARLQPLQSFKCLMWAYILIALMHLIAGGFLYNAQSSIIQMPIRTDAQGNSAVGARYHDECVAQDGIYCIVPFRIEMGMNTKDHPIVLFYELDKFYQNHRRYSKSISGDQLRGEPNEDISGSNLEWCWPRLFSPKNDSTDPTKCTAYSWTSFSADFQQCEVITPCGLVVDPETRFTDDFQLFRGTPDAPEEQIELDKGTPEEPAITFDYLTRFDNTADWLDSQVTDNMSPQFVVWARTALTPHFRKNYALIRQEEGLPIGDYYMNITNRMDHDIFEGSKAFGLTTLNTSGGKHPTLALVCMLVMAVCVLSLIMIGMSYRLRDMEKMVQELVERQQVVEDTLLAEVEGPTMDYSLIEELQPPPETQKAAALEDTPPATPPKVKKTRKPKADTNGAANGANGQDVEMQAAGEGATPAKKKKTKKPKSQAIDTTSITTTAAGAEEGSPEKKKKKASAPDPTEEAPVKEPVKEA